MPNLCKCGLFPKRDGGNDCLSCHAEKERDRRLIEKAAKQQQQCEEVNLQLSQPYAKIFSQPDELEFCL